MVFVAVPDTDDSMRAQIWHRQVRCLGHTLCGSCVDLGLAGQKALVTAGSRGIGRAITERLVAEGMQVAICTRSSDGIRANAVSPGPIYIDGGSWDRIRQKKPEYYEANKARHPSGRFGRADEVADAPDHA